MAHPSRAHAVVAWAVFAVAVALAAGAGVLWPLNERVASGVFPPQIFVVPGFGLIGAIITSRRRNLIGPLFLALATFGAATAFTFEYAVRALETAPGSLPFGGYAAALSNAGFPFTWLAFGLTLLLFPDGRLPSPRWRPFASAFTALWGLLTVLSLFVPVLNLASFRISNPIGFGGPTILVDYDRAPRVATILNIVGFALLIATAAAPIVRRRRADPETRLQLRWPALALESILVLTLPTIVLAYLHSDTAVAVLSVGILLVVALGIPAAIGIAVIQYKLYDIDVVIRKTVVFGLLAAFITVVYVLIVGVVSTRFARAGSFVAAATLAVLFAPARERARKIADRLVYGTRATPYEVLAEFSERVGETYSADDVLSRMALVLMEGTGAVGARVLLRVGLDQREAAAVGARGEETVVDVAHQGEALGALAVSMPPADPMNPTRRKLVEDLASQAGLVLRNVKLIEELKASRTRLVAAQDEERRKIERNIHDGAQQQLVALAVQLKLASQLVGKDPEKERALLEKLGVQAGEALEDLRDLARGIYPPLLADKGLGAALETQARKSVVPATVEATGIGRFPQDVESAVYFSCLEALQNVAKYANASRATIALSSEDGELRFSVVDDGVGFDPMSTGYGSGLQGIADRLAAIGGTIAVMSAPGDGARVSGTIPIAGP